MCFARRIRDWSPTIRFRLTMWGAGITATVCLLLCTMLYYEISRSLQHEVDSFLEGEVNELGAILQEHHLDMEAAQQSVRVELGGRTRRDLSFRVLDSAGGLIISSEQRDQPGSFWMPPADWDPRPGRSLFHTVSSPELTSPVRLCSQRFTSQVGQAYVIQAGYRLDQTTVSLRNLRRISTTALAVSLVAAVVGGGIMAGRSLRPIQSMIHQAKRITEHRIDERLPLRGTGDELDRLGATLNELLDRVQLYVRRMQQFTADASHELRSPLAALRGNAEVVLTRERSAAELRQVVEESVEHYTRLGRIAEDLLLLARFDAGEQVLRREPSRLNAALADVVDLYGPMAADHGITLLLHKDGEVIANVDGGRLRQVAGNLVDNAIKYTPAPGRIDVGCTKAGDFARITVSDTGTGIAVEEQNHVFDRFYRVDRARSQARCPGSGLGLSICRSIVEAHGGTIELLSVPGRGTTVTVLLPLCSTG